MTKLPVVSGKQVIKALKHAGFQVHHQKGSHITLRREEYPHDRIVVPDHRVVKKGALGGIIRDAGLTVEEFVEML